MVGLEQEACLINPTCIGIGVRMQNIFYDFASGQAGKSSGEKKCAWSWNKLFVSETLHSLKLQHVCKAQFGILQRDE